MAALPRPSCSSLQDPEEMLECVQREFSSFHALLERNNQVLKIVGDMEEKALGEYLFDLHYVRSSLREVRAGVSEIIDRLIALGGEHYEPLRTRYETIDRAIARLLPDERPIPESPYVLDFDQVGREHALSVGNKNAQLGELRRLGVPAPSGFAVTAWAYKRFLDENELTDRIRRHIEAVDLRNYDDLVRVSSEVQSAVEAAHLPAGLGEAIAQGYASLEAGRPDVRVAVRSSGIGEDTMFSFAGQHATFLNVGPAELVRAWLGVVASKFTPQAIYYFLSHALTEAELAMSVGFVPMVNAQASGVVYTRDPLHPADETLLVHAVFGLGEALVSGSVTPDVLRIDRAARTVIETTIADKPTRTVMRPEGGTRVEPLPAAERAALSLDPALALELAAYALRIEQHYGRPQDIEWALDATGELLILQTRPLHVLSDAPASVVTAPVDPAVVLLSAGTMACPGAGSGPVVIVRTGRDLSRVAPGAVVVAPQPFAGLITVMGKASALVTEVGGSASHTATLAREYGLPTLVGVVGACALEPGQLVTVDATGGRILCGLHPALVAARRRQAAHSFEDSPLFRGFREILALVAPLNLLHPADPSFRPENCQTLHDVTRYAHQTAMAEMFARASRLERTAHVGLALESEIPLPVSVLYVDRVMPERASGKIQDREIDCIPFQAFWDGMRKQGWPSGPSIEGEGFSSVIATEDPSRNANAYRIESYAVVARYYMLVSLHLGYHFTTIEAMATAEPGKNYIRLQHKDGGAALERRVRRIRLVAALLARLGFENASQSDFLDASIAYLDADAIALRLFMIGRIVLMTKQLDMALSNDRITEWYTRDFLRKLGLGEDESG